MGPAFDKARAKCDEQFLRGPETELHVIGAGLPRTGTTSLAAALEMLYPGLPCHQMEVAALQPEQCEQWLALDAALREGGVSQTDAAPALRALVRNHAAAVDVPACMFYNQLAQEFPRAKVVLTVHPRGAAGWYASTMATLFPLQLDVLARTWLGGVQPFRAFHRLAMGLYFDGFLTRDEWRARETATRRYEEWNALVAKLVPAERLLVFDVSDGWAPLCAFLGKPVPSEPFPHLNTTLFFARVLACASCLTCSRCRRGEAAADEAPTRGGAPAAAAGNAPPRKSSMKRPGARKDD